jgi:hypothetical protein
LNQLAGEYQKRLLWFGPAYVSILSAENVEICVLWIVCSIPLYGAAGEGLAGSVGEGDDGSCSHVGSVEADPSVARIIDAISAPANGESKNHEESAECTVDMEEPKRDWTKRY